MPKRRSSTNVVLRSSLADGINGGLIVNHQIRPESPAMCSPAAYQPARTEAEADGQRIEDRSHALWSGTLAGHDKGFVLHSACDEERMKAVGAGRVRQG